MKHSLLMEAGAFVDRPSSILFEKWICREGDGEGLDKEREEKEKEKERAPVLPLEIIQTEDEQQMELLLDVLKNRGDVVRYYLLRVVFPSTTQQQRVKVIFFLLLPLPFPSSFFGFVAHFDYISFKQVGKI